MSDQSNLTSVSAIDILLVEDDPDDARLALYALKQTHSTSAVHTLSDGEQALDYFFNRVDEMAGKTPLPRLVLLDLKMTKVNGLEVLEKIRAHPSTQAIPIVVFTSSVQEQDVIDSYELGVNSFVVKPIGIQDFKLTVQQVATYWLELNIDPRTTIR
jgi:two-component system, response regulator